MLAPLCDLVRGRVIEWIEIGCSGLAPLPVLPLHDVGSSL
jgi:hypothetical protein